MIVDCHQAPWNLCYIFQAQSYCIYGRLLSSLKLLISKQKGPGRGGSGIQDSNFKQVRDSGFRFQTGRDSGFRFQFANMLCFRILYMGFKFQPQKFMGFKSQGSFVGFIFQSGWDSGFTFQMGGIQDSNYVFRGPNRCTPEYSVLLYTLRKVLLDKLDR